MIDYSNEIKDAIANGKKITLITYHLSEKMEKQIDSVVSLLLSHYNKAELQPTLYSLIKEMVVNGTKANAKHIFLQELNINSDVEQDYHNGMIQMKEKLSEDFIIEYGQKAKTAGLDVKITFFHNNDGIRVEVTNNLTIIPADEKRLRLKLKEGMGYDDLASFYMANVDNTEGEGIGLVMNLLLLKAENIDPALFRVATNDGFTTARVEIPLSENFVSVRGKNPAGFPS
jgi:hypothetical protein